MTAANEPCREEADLETLLQRFEEAWQRGDRPDLAAYLPVDPSRQWTALVELAHIDLEQRLKSGEAARSEAYFQRFPELAADDEEALLLVARELELRQRLEPNLVLDEFRRRFPRFSTDLLSALGTSDQTCVDPSLAPRPQEEDAEPGPTADSPLASLVTLPALLPAEVRQELAGLQESFTEAQSLTEALVRRGWLTDFQAQRVLRGQGHRLILGPYVLLDQLGEGGMGVVYKARPTDGDGLVALKVLLKERLQRRDALRRFRREVQAATCLDHPNIVRVFEARQALDAHYLVMECIAGMDLQRLVEAAGPLPVSRACDFIRQAAQGLHHAHEKGLVHRDIKPSNLMVALASGKASPSSAELLVPGAVLKILDMGLARLRIGSEPQEEWSTLTKAGTIIGTPDYMAPEQWEDAHRSDIRADLYSLGCTLHYLLIGQVPFPGGTLIQKLDRHRSQPPVPVERLRPDLPVNLGPIVKKLLAKKPGERFQTPAELVETLERSLSGSRFTPRAEIARRLQEEAGIVAGLVRSFQGHLGSVNSVAVATDGRHMLSGGDDHTLRLWEIESGREVRQSKGQTDAFKCVALSPDGRHAISGGTDRSVRLWDMATGRVVRVFSGHTDVVKCVAIAPDNRYALSGGNDRIIRLWEMSSGRRLLRLEGNSGDITTVRFSPDGRQFLSASWDKSVRLWDVKTGKEMNRFGGTYSSWQWLVILDLAFAPDGRRFAAGGSDSVLRLCHLDDGRELAQFVGHADKITSVAFSPDGTQILTGSADKTVRLWDVERGRERHSFDGHASAVTSVAFTPDGRQAVSAATDSTVRLWRLPR